MTINNQYNNYFNNNDFKDLLESKLENDLFQSSKSSIKRSFDSLSSSFNTSEKNHKTPKILQVSKSDEDFKGSDFSFIGLLPILEPVSNEVDSSNLKLKSGNFFRLKELIENDVLKEWQKIQILIHYLHNFTSNHQLLKQNPDRAHVEFDDNGNLSKYFIKTKAENDLKVSSYISICKNFAEKIFIHGIANQELKQLIQNLGTTALGRLPAYEQLKKLETRLRADSSQTKFHAIP